MPLLLRLAPVSGMEENRRMMRGEEAYPAWRLLCALHNNRD